MHTKYREEILTYNNYKTAGTYLGLCATRRALIKEAIEKNVVFEEGAEGTVSRPATPEEVAEFVQSIYDDAVYNLLVTMSSTAATERLVESYGFSLFSRVPEIIPLMEEEKKRRMPLYPFFTEGTDRE